MSWGSQIGDRFERLWAQVQRRRPVMPGHEVTARETRTALGLMHDAAGAGSAMTDEQRMFMAQSAPGMRAREAVLLGIPNRSLVEENELQMIRREMARIDGRTAPQDARTVSPRRFAFLGATVGASPWMAVLVSPLTWIAAGLALIGVQTARLNHVKHELVEARSVATANARAAAGWQERAEHYRTGLIDAAEVAHQAAEALTSERAARDRAAARERSRNREIANVLAHSPDPPAWRLRDDEPLPSDPAASSP